MKLTSIPRKLWEHKKKSTFASLIAYFTGWKIYNWKRDCNIRAIYAREAKQFGDAPLDLAERLRRVTVLVDKTCASAFDSFEKNALPLLNLAGLQVDIIKPNDISEFKTIAEHIDTTECDALYIIGGDNALSIVLSAVCRQENNSPLPIGVFPGGSDNRSLIVFIFFFFGRESMLELFPYGIFLNVMTVLYIRLIFVSKNSLHIVNGVIKENIFIKGKKKVYLLFNNYMQNT
ncbi:unnamed protein product [Brugia pahangi]|uniref:DAGKc domain-containing protein n=1 Tax=Brugia pahangi TaxID=6280 RepID=A0A0N4TGS2_BRUPA|nr:unnamed protein product [Brugia pahangi]